MHNSTVVSHEFNSTLLMSHIEEIEKPISLQFSEQVIHIALSPYEECQELAVIVFRSNLSISSIKFQDKESDAICDPILYKELQSVEVNDVHLVCWSPESSLITAPYQIVFACTSKVDFDIKIIRSNIVDNFTEKALAGHCSYVNSVAYDPTGNFMASASDDLTCKVWNAKNDYTTVNTFYLLSPGMSVCWQGRLLAVGEKSGTVRVYAVGHGDSAALLSLQTDLGPLSAIAVLPTANYVAALAGPHLVLWSTTAPSCPLNSWTVHTEGARHICFIMGCGGTPKIITAGVPGYTLKVTSVDKSVSTATSTISSLKLVSNISSHATLPYIAVGVYKEVQLWKTTSF